MKVLCISASNNLKEGVKETVKYFEEWSDFQLFIFENYVDKVIRG